MQIRKQARRGAFIIGVIVVMMIIATLVMAFTRSLVTQSRASRTRWRHRQASWLAESGLNRGAAQLAANQNYAGETWRIPSEQLKGGAEVRIEVSSTDSEAANQTLRVIAKYPLASPIPATVETKIELSPTTSGDES